jgi:hypothetical protein
MRRGEFHHHETIIVENEHFQLECLADAGPRIVRLIPAWAGENIFAEAPNTTIPTARGEYHYFGGHRLWIAPESPTQTYFADDEGVVAKKVLNGLKLVGSIEPDTHIRKTIFIQMSPGRPFIMVKHTIKNCGRDSIQLAPWAVTMMRPGSMAILPQQFGAVDKDGVLPNRNFALWSYSRWDDPRLKLDEEFIRIRSDATKHPFKLGYFNPHGWLGYVFEDVFFVKRFGVRRDEAYPDHGCNAEVYTTDQVIELSSLAAVVELKPQEEVVHTETWEVYETNNMPKDLLGGKDLSALLK